MSIRITLLACAGLAALALIFATVVAPGPGPASATGGVEQVTAGGWHTCGVTARGSVRCWGYNSSGQLGDGTTTDRAIPGNISGLASSVTITAVAAGDSHTCALTAEGGVKCWGGNHDGQLGDGTTTDRTAPVDVSGLAGGVTALAAGGSHTCALTAGGGVKCWGDNSDGQLGDGTTADRTAPVDVSGLASGVTALAAGGSYTCALTAGGGVKCWGSNVAGQLGDGTTTDRTAPGDVSGLANGVTALAADGSHTCALTAGGGVKCWGDNGDGELGDGTTTDRATPVDVFGLASGVTALVAGDAHTCALTAGGGVKCWGYNSGGRLGDGTTTDRAVPGDVSGLASGATALAAGGSHTCALTAGDGVKCWGGNSDGRLGDGTTTDRTAPVDVVDWFYQINYSSPFPIPDGDPTGIEHSLIVSASAGDTIEDLNVFLDITHTWVGDLIVTLTHDDTGTSAALIDRPGIAPPILTFGCDGNDVYAVLDDDVLTAVEDECDTFAPAIDGDFTPNEPLSVFDGESMAGTWTLRVSDVQGGDLGTLDAMALYVVTSGKEATPTPTATNTPSATPTATSPAATPIAPTTTATPPAPTPTTSPGRLSGDADCSGTINAIDAALLLQFGAGLIGSLPCQANADINSDGTINAIDAALILQFVAGLVPALPP